MSERNRERERESEGIRAREKGRQRAKQTDSQIIGSLLSFASSSFHIFTSCNANEL
jgi:hypothetical protein